MPAGGAVSALALKAAPMLIGQLGKGKASGGGSSSLGGGGSKPGAAQAGLGIATGLLQTIQANKLKQKSEGAFPDLVDPNQSAFLSELNQKRKSIDTGADFAAGMQSADTTNAGVNDAIIKSTGGDTGSTIQSLLQSQRATGDTKNNILAQGQQQQINYDSMYGRMLDQMAGRKLQLQMQRSQQAKAEWAKKQQFASQNLNAGVAGLTSLLSQGSGGAGNTPTSNATGAMPPSSNGAGAAPTLTQRIDPGMSPEPAGESPDLSVLSPLVSK